MGFQIIKYISGEYTILSSDITAVTTGTYIQYATIPLAKLIGIKTQVALTLDGGIVFNKSWTETALVIDSAGNEYKFSTDATNLYIAVPIGTWADIAACRTALTSTSPTICIYQLATPLTYTQDQFPLIGLTVTGDLSATLDGTREWIATDYDLLPSSIEIEYPRNINQSVSNLTSVVSSNNNLTNYRLNQIPNKNYLINGNFDVWQRGTSFIENHDRFLADRWKHITSNIVTTINATISSDVPNDLGLNKSIKISNSNNSNRTYLIQQIEDVTKFSGQFITISFYAKSSSNIEAFCYVDINYDGSLPEYGIGIKSVELTSNWKRYENIIFIPSSIGKTIGSNNNLAVVFSQDLSTSEIYIAGFKLELGNKSTPFIPNTFSEELALCQRYYEKTFSYSVSPENGTDDFNGSLSAGSVSSTFQPISNWRYNVTKRITPTVTLFNPSSVGGSGQWSNGITSGINARSFYGNEFGITIDNSEAVLTTGTYSIHAVADSEL